jgi:hypothetical protein
MNLDTHPLRPQIRLLLTTALGLFVFTVVVGILNGTDIVDFERKVLLTHVHVGTLGWITLSVFAGTLWLFGAGETPPGFRSSWPRIGAPLGAASVTVYAIAFLTTENWARPIIGAVTALAILGFFAWAVIQGRTVPMSVPRWGLLYALATSVTGGVLGVLYGILLASDIKALPDGGEDAHPATMVVGFLVPVGMALAEWGLRPEANDTKATRVGFWQMTLLFLGGVTLMLGILLDVVPLIMLNLPFEIAAVVMFLVRNWSAFPKVGWSEGRPAPYFLATSVAISKYAEDFDLTPTRLLLALDHVMFIGVMTNSIFGLMRIATDGARAAVAPWADRVVFWAMNAGLAVFWIGLVTDTAWPKRIATPVMGTAILLGVGVYFIRMRRTPCSALTETPAA